MATIPELVKSAINSRLVHQRSPLLGCQRQNSWSRDNEDWRNWRGNALLELVGTKIEVSTPVGNTTIYTTWIEGQTFALLFRGGKWKPWWEEDAQLVCALAGDIDGALVLHELDGKLDVVYITPSPDSDTLVEKAVERLTTEGRIAKNSPRALAICPHCSVKGRCDALDLERGETVDWPPHYRVGQIDDSSRST